APCFGISLCELGQLATHLRRKFRRGLSLVDKKRGVKILEVTLLKQFLHIRDKSGVEYFLRVRPPGLTALTRENRYVRAFKAFDHRGIDEAQVPLEINPSEPPKSHNQPEVQPNPLHFGESFGSGISLQHQWDHVF